MGHQGGLPLQIRYEKIFEKNLRTTLTMTGGELGGPGGSVRGPEIYMAIGGARLGKWRIAGGAMYQGYMNDCFESSICTKPKLPIFGSYLQL